MTPTPPRFERNAALVVLALLLVGCVVVMIPFLSALLWAVVLCFSSWPIYRRLLDVMRGRRTLAALCMTLMLILLLLVPFVIIGTTLAENVKEFTAATRQWMTAGPPSPPEWLRKVPLVGNMVSDYWHSLADDTAKLLKAAQRLIEPASSWLLRGGLALGSGLLELALSVFIAFFLFRDGVSASERLLQAVERLGGDTGRHLLTVAGNTVRGVVYGILGTALVQAVMAGVGFVIAGVPGAGLLALLTFFFSIVPMGPPLIWIPATIWLFNTGHTGMGIFMGVWGLAVSSIDNVVKPWLISQGSDMPFLLIFFGVLGGALGFGFIGVFLGPTLLAVGFRMWEEWGARRPVIVTPESIESSEGPGPAAE
jgi:predicted PurR-regulated permease PerM